MTSGRESEWGWCESGCGCGCVCMRMARTKKDEAHLGEEVQQTGKYMKCGGICERGWGVG